MYRYLPLFTEDRKTNIDDVGLALHIINKVAKIIRDEQSEIRDYLYNESVNKYTLRDIVQGNDSEYFSHSNSIVDHNDYYIILSDAHIDSIVRNLRDQLYENEDILDNDDELDEDEIEYHEKCVRVIDSLIESYGELRREYASLRPLIGKLEDKKRKLYQLKQDVLEKLNLPIEKFHSFGDGSIRPMYTIGNFSYHGKDIDELDDSIVLDTSSVEKIEGLIDSNVKIDSRMSVVRAVKLLSDFISGKANF